MRVWGHLLLVESFASSFLHRRSLRVRAHREPIGPVGRKLVFRIYYQSLESDYSITFILRRKYTSHHFDLEGLGSSNRVESHLVVVKDLAPTSFHPLFLEGRHTQRPTSRSTFGAGEAFSTWLCPAEDEILEIKISDWSARMSTPMVEIFLPAISHPRRLESRAHITTYPGGGKAVYKSYHQGASWDTRPQHHRCKAKKTWNGQTGSFWKSC
jgi:hypothetical protein